MSADAVGTLHAAATAASAIVIDKVSPGTRTTDLVLGLTRP